MSAQGTAQQARTHNGTRPTLLGTPFRYPPLSTPLVTHLGTLQHPLSGNAPRQSSRYPAGTWRGCAAVPARWTERPCSTMARMRWERAMSGSCWSCWSWCVLIVANRMCIARRSPRRAARPLARRSFMLWRQRTREERGRRG
eukprot:2642060-Rhodomonas_salina.8